MCDNCGCHTQAPAPDAPKTKDAKPDEWHVHADGTAHRHDHVHDPRGGHRDDHRHDHDRPSPPR